MNMNRIVQVYEQIKNPKWGKGNNQPAHITVDLGKGIFHQWGSNFEEFSNGAVECTVAIVELPDGSIITPDPLMVKFIKNDE